MELNEPFNFDITHFLIVCDTAEHIYNDAGMTHAKLEKSAGWLDGNSCISRKNTDYYINAWSVK